MVYADNVNSLSESSYSVNRNTSALSADVDAVGLEVNAEWLKDMHISREQNAGQNHQIRTGNESFEVVAVFRHEQQ